MDDRRELVIYKHKDKPGWYLGREYKDELEAWQKVREAFVQAFQKAKVNDWNTIDDLAPLHGGPVAPIGDLRAEGHVQVRLMGYPGPEEGTWVGAAASDALAWAPSVPEQR
jgi:hypothetical protein